MATTTQQHPKNKHHHPRFPRMLGRFINLEGGIYGSLELIAITDQALEVQWGDSDFLRFDRDQATNLRDTIDKFLALDKGAAGEAEELVEAEAVEVLEEVVTRPKRRAHKHA
jgi:preprotein translocase subunit YajC